MSTDYLARLAELDDRSARLFAADCAEDVLPLFEAEFPTDPRPRHAIDVARQFAVGEATKEELAAAHDAAHGAAHGADYYWTLSLTPEASDAADAAFAAYYATDQSAPTAATESAFYAALAALRDSERAWQEARLNHYLALEGSK